jgi:GTP-binding protein HflX
MDLYEKNTFDEWLGDDTKKEILEDLKERWLRETNGNAVFISATERKNIDLLRKIISEKVRTMYKSRYPYKKEYYPLHSSNEQDK